MKTKKFFTAFLLMLSANTIIAESIELTVKTEEGTNVKIQSNGRIIPCTNKNFSIPLGAKMNISSGRIK